MFKRKSGGLLVLAFIAALHVSAGKKQYTIAEATNGLSGSLATKGLKQASWAPSSDKLYQVVKTGDGSAWISTSFPKGETDTVTTLHAINKVLYGTDKLKAMPTLKWLDDGVYFEEGSDLQKGTLTSSGVVWQHWATTPADVDTVTAHKSGAFTYALNNNLWLVNKQGKTIQLTTDGSKDILNGLSVHRDEFGIDHGVFFSPDGNYVAYYRMDQSMVKDYPIIKWSDSPASVNLIKYPMAGGTSHQVSLKVYNIATGKTVTLNTEGQKDHYLTCVSWSPDERYVYIAVLNREQNHMWLNQYDVQTGAKVKTLFEETNDKYVEPLHELTFLPGMNDRFIWWSQRSGFMHLYLYSTDGSLIRRITKGDWLVNEIIGYNSNKNELIITATKESAKEKHGYAVNINTGHMRRLDNEAGWHTLLATDDGHYVLDVFNGAGIPKRTIVRGVDNNYEKVLVDSPDPLADYDRPTIKNVTLYADDGTPLYGKLILPTHFDASKKYPVIVYLYNGPHIQLIKNTFPESGNLWYEYMAQHGYIVFSMDGRGSGNRGLAFEQVIFRHLGRAEIADQLQGVRYLKSLPYVDGNRMGIHGWSFGGFMTTTMMLKHPDVFKVAVAGGPVMDWRMYEIMYTERYMDTPRENPEGYEEANLLDKVQNLKGKLLLIHGTDDNTVVWQHSINFLKKAVDNNIQVDYFVYPGYEHNVRGKDRVHLMQKISDYFDQNLK